MSPVSSTSASDASVLLLRKSMDAQKSQAQALLQVLPTPSSLGPGKGHSVDVYA
jgi:putative motility protein YjfB-like